MNYNEKTGDFEKTLGERVGYVIGYIGWWGFKIAVLTGLALAVCMVGKLIWRKVGL